MKKIKLSITLALLSFSTLNVLAQCQPIVFPTGTGGSKVCLEGASPSPNQDICFQNDSGNLNFLFNNTNKKFSFNNIATSTYDNALGMGTSPDGTNSGLRIDYKNNSGASNSFFRNFSTASYFELLKEFPGNTQSILGIDSPTQSASTPAIGNSLTLFTYNNFASVKLSAATTGTNFFMNKVGIGMTNPTEMLEVNGNGKFYGNSLKLSPSANDAVIQRTTTGNLMLSSGGGTSTIYLNYNYGGGSGGVNISDGTSGDYTNLKVITTKLSNSSPSATQTGTFLIKPSGGRTIISDGVIPATPAGYALYVTTGILTDKVKVAVNTTANWSDYVFEKNYNLMPLTDVEKFITKNQHLPEIPSANEMVKEGLDLGEMQAKQMKKIEEFTLYLIEMKKEIESLKNENKELKNENKELKKAISNLK